MTICTARFEPLATQLLEAMDRPDLPLAVIEHPLGDVDPAGLDARASVVVARLAEVLGRQATSGDAL